MTRNKKISMVATVLVLIAGFMGALDLVGKTATPAKIIAVYFGGIGAGVGLMAAIRYQGK